VQEPEIVQRVKRYAGQTMRTARNPNITARECIDRFQPCLTPQGYSGNRPGRPVLAVGGSTLGSIESAAMWHITIRPRGARMSST
jgi:hypothetical protein